MYDTKTLLWIEEKAAVAVVGEGETYDLSRVVDIRGLRQK